MADYIDRQAVLSALDDFAKSLRGSGTGWNGNALALMAKGVISGLPSQWVSVEDALPPGGKDVLLAIGRTDVFTGYYVGGRYYDSEGCGTYGVTHWMPLPDAPEVPT